MSGCSSYVFRVSLQQLPPGSVLGLTVKVFPSHTMPKVKVEKNQKERLGYNMSVLRSSKRSTSKTKDRIVELLGRFASFSRQTQSSPSLSKGSSMRSSDDARAASASSGIEVINIKVGITDSRRRPSHKN
jgi:hypothetical protein